MTPLLIFEGIASSGKTTLERKLHEQMEGSVIVSEGQTLMPLIDNRDSHEAVGHLLGILDVIEKQPARAFIIDRFHLTHAFRTGVPLSLFGEIEKQIGEKFSPIIILLKIDEEVILDRIEETDALRGMSWTRGKQGSLEERAAYYKNQQRALTELTKQSRLPTLVVDTTDKNWFRCLRGILSALAQVESATAG